MLSRLIPFIAIGLLTITTYADQNRSGLSYGKDNLVLKGNLAEGVQVNATVIYAPDKYLSPNRKDCDFPEDQMSMMAPSKVSTFDAKSLKDNYSLILPLKAQKKSCHYVISEIYFYVSLKRAGPAPLRFDSLTIQLRDHEVQDGPKSLVGLGGMDCPFTGDGTDSTCTIQDKLVELRYSLKPKAQVIDFDIKNVVLQTAESF